MKVLSTKNLLILKTAIIIKIHYKHGLKIGYDTSNKKLNINLFSLFFVKSIS
jgi:hypothetical protein